MTTKHKLSLLAATAIGLVATQAQAQYVGNVTTTGSVATANGGNTCGDGTTTGGYTTINGSTYGNVVTVAGTDVAQTLCGDYDVTKTFFDNNSVATGYNGDAAVAYEYGYADSQNEIAVELTDVYDTTTLPATYLYSAGGSFDISTSTVNDYYYEVGTATDQYNLHSDYTVAYDDGSGQGTGYGFQVNNTVTASSDYRSYSNGTSSFDPLTGDVSYTATNGGYNYNDAGTNYFQTWDNVAGTWSESNQNSNGFFVDNSTGAVSALTANGLTTSGDVTATTGNFGTINTALINGTGPDGSLTLHGGTASTTVVLDNAGMHVSDSTNGLTFDVSNTGNGYFAGDVQADSFYSVSGNNVNVNNAGGQAITWNDGTNYYTNSQGSSYNQLSWSDGSNYSVNYSDSFGTYAYDSTGAYANLTAGGLNTNGTVSANTVNATTANLGTANVGTLNVSGLTSTNGIANTGNVTTDTLTVNGASSFAGLVTSNGIANTGNVTTDTLTVNGASSFAGLVTSNGIANTGNVTTDTLNVNGTSTFGGLVTANGGVTTTTLTAATGNITTVNSTTVNTGTLNASGNASVGGNLAVTGNSTIGGNETVTGTITGGALVSVGTTTVGTNLTVNGTSNLLGAITNTGTANGGAVYVNDALTVNGPVTVGTIVASNTTNKISGLANATLSSTSTEAVTGQQLFATNTALTALDAREAAHFSLLSQRADKAYQGIAMGFAANAAPLNLDNGEGGISGGVGVFQGQWGGAIRAQYVTDSGVGVGVNFGFSEDAVGGGVGASIKF